MAIRFCDEHPSGFGWIHPEPGFMERASHALRAGDDGGVVLVDPVDDPALDARLRQLGEPVAVVQLLDRHTRDGAALAARYGVPLHRLPAGRVPGTALEAVPVVDVPGWRERALWWAAERVLLVPEALGTPAYFRAPGERLGVHPMLRLLPPARLLAWEPAHLLFGHGEGVHEGAAAAMRDAVAGSRRRSPAWAAARVRELAAARRR
jgi:hypothetical protein